MNTHLLSHPRRIGTAYLLLFSFGLLGVHRFYIRHTGLGIAYLFTLAFSASASWSTCSFCRPRCTRRTSG